MSKRIDDIKVVSVEDAKAISTFVVVAAQAIEADNGDALEVVMDTLKFGTLTIPAEETVAIVQGLVIVAAKAMVDVKRLKAGK